MIETINPEDRETAQYIYSLADSLSIHQWKSTTEKLQFVICWVELYRNEEPVPSKFFSSISQALMSAVHALANHLYDEEAIQDQWGVIFNNSEQYCNMLELEIPRVDVTTRVLRIASDHITNLATDEYSYLYFDTCQGKNLWDTHDNNDPDSQVGAAVVAALSSLLVAFVESVDIDRRKELSERLHDLVQDVFSLPIEVMESRKNKKITGQARQKGIRKVKVEKDSPREPEVVSTFSLPEISHNDPCFDILQEMLQKRELAVRENNKKQSKPFYSNNGADYLLTAVAKVLTSQAVSPVISGRDLAKHFLDQAVIIDSRVIVKNSGTLHRAPQSAIKGRLISIYSYFEGVNVVDALRVPKNVGANVLDFTGTPIDSQYAVALFRLTTPLGRYNNDMSL